MHVYVIYWSFYLKLKLMPHYGAAYESWMSNAVLQAVDQ